MFACPTTGLTTLGQCSIAQGHRQEIETATDRIASSGATKRERRRKVSSLNICTHWLQRDDIEN